MTWFEEWFDSPYYHILYKNRDEKEACYFIDHLIEKLHLQTNTKVLDLACGRGRHSVYLNQQGFEVTGVDLSDASITHARQFENNRLSFFVHDMRQSLYLNYFDTIFNLFTSFGYFDNEAENHQVLKAAYDGLKPGGLFIIDYLNSKKVIDHMLRRETKIVDGITFEMRRALLQGFITKQINFSDKGTDYVFHEKVRALKHDQLVAMLQKAGFTVTHQFGDYYLNPFIEAQSDRVILVARK
jgi:SAM-dependent methyltransferase